MKKSNSWIHVCVHFLLFMTLGVHSATLDVGRVTNDIDKHLLALRENIPEDYRIPLTYIPREKGEMCWVKLNVFFLEKSLDDLSQKFGNISSNKDITKLIIMYLQDERIIFQQNVNLELLISDFECHYSTERWETGTYFDFLQELFRAAPNENVSEECDPPPCPTIPVSTEEYSAENLTIKGEERSKPHQKEVHTANPIHEVVEKSLFSLLFIPLLALIFLLAWKARSRRNVDDPLPNPGEEDRFATTEPRAPPLDSETNVLNVCAV
uniref:Kit ligand n=1 Tax=Fundulus heteroclitus TaxID=8078 RepID=A0A3Q2PAV9_FUNHE